MQNKDVLQFAKYSLLKDIMDIIEQLYPFDIINKIMQIPESFDLISIKLSINKGLPKDVEIYENTDMYYKINDIVENNTKFIRYRKEVSIFHPIMLCDKYPLACGIIQLYYLKLTYAFNCNY